MPFLLNILASLDSSGRSASAAPAFFTLGGAIGPVVAGLLIGKAGIANTGAVLAGVAFCGLLLAILSSAKAPQRGVSAQGA
jgi:predicted MFS family arabinose efflux permease